MVRCEAPLNGLLDRMRGVLGVRDFQLVMLASFAWYAARWVDTVTTGWYALELTGSPVFLSLVSAGRTLPMFLFGVLGGVLADRYRPRRILIVALCTNIAVLLWLIIASAGGAIVAWQLIATTFLINTAWALAFPAQRVLIADTIGQGSATTALAVDQFMFVIANVVFAAMAGALIPVTGPAGAYALAILTVAVGLPFAFAVRSSRGGRHLQPSTSPAATSYRSVVGIPVVLGVIVVSAVVNCLSLPLPQLLPLIARDLLQVGPVELGLLSSAYGGGTLVGALVLFSLAPRRGGLLFLLGSLSGAGMFFVFSFLSSFPIAVACIFLAGVLIAAFGTYQSSLIIEATSPADRARALGAVTVAIGMQPLGVVATGALAGAASTPIALRVGAGLAMTAIAVVMVLAPGLRSHVTRGGVVGGQSRKPAAAGD